MNILLKNIDLINNLCDENQVKKLFAFGSVTTDKFHDQSDIDFIVEIDDQDPISYTDKYFNLKFRLEQILHRQIDLLEEKAIRNRFLKDELDRTKVLVYG